MFARLAFSSLLLLAGCGEQVSTGRYLYVAGSTEQVADFVAKERSCRPKLTMTRPRAERGTRSQVVVSVPQDYSPEVVAQLAREAKAAGLRYSLKERSSS